MVVLQMIPFLMSTSIAGVFPYEVHSKNLDNGLTVVVVPMPGGGVVSYNTWMHVGSRDELTEGRTGFAHFFEHLMFQGSKDLPRTARGRRVLQLGVEENAWTDNDETVYHGSLSSENLPGYVELESDRFRNLHLTAEHVAKEAGAVYGEFRKSQANPGNKLWERVQDVAYLTHTYGHTTLGYEEDIEAMPDAVDYALAFFDQHYRPEHATILVVGDVDVDVAMKLVEDNYADWQSGTLDLGEVPVEAPQEGIRRETVGWEGPAAPEVSFNWRMPATDYKDRAWVSLTLAEHLLDSDVGTLQLRLVREEALAYSVWCGADASVDPGLFRIGVTLRDAEHFERVEEIVREEVAALQQGVDEAFLDQTRTHRRYRFLTGLSSPGTVAYRLGKVLRRGGGVDGLDAYYELYDTLTVEDLKTATSTWLVDDNLTVVELRPEVAQ